ncbi:MAG: hypothetical protein ACI9QL_003986, partial [Candidatus Omnitrophota bacterium]
QPAHNPPTDGNTAIGEVEALASTGNIVYSGDRLTALVGVDDLIVVQAEGVTLICAKDKAQDIKQLVQRFKDQGTHSELL